MQRILSRAVSSHSASHVITQIYSIENIILFKPFSSRNSNFSTTSYANLVKTSIVGHVPSVGLLQRPTKVLASVILWWSK